MSIHDRIDNPPKAELQAAIELILTLPREYKRDERDDFEPVPEDFSDWRHEGADRLEARETSWRLGR